MKNKNINIAEFPYEENLKYMYFESKRDNLIIFLNFIKNKLYHDDLNILKLKALCYLEKNLPDKSIYYQDHKYYQNQLYLTI